MTFASRTQCHVERPWGKRPFSIQPGEGPSRGLLRAYELSDGTFSSTTEHVFTPFLTAALWLQRLLLVTVFCIPNGGSLNIRPGYHRPAQPGSGQYDLM